MSAQRGRDRGQGTGDQVVGLGDVIRMGRLASPAMVGCLAEVTDVDRRGFTATLTVPGFHANRDPSVRTNFRFEHGSPLFDIVVRAHTEEAEAPVGVTAPSVSDLTPAERKAGGLVLEAAGWRLRFDSDVPWYFAWWMDMNGGRECCGVDAYFEATAATPSLTAGALKDGAGARCSAYMQRLEREG